MRGYVALLRGVNVGGRNRLPMAGLRAALGSLPVERVQTYLQSGNVVFAAGDQDGPSLAPRIEAVVAATFGLEVSVLVRDRLELDAVVSGNPFTAEGMDPAKLHVTFLAVPADPARVAGLDPSVGGADRFRVVGTTVYLCCPTGYGNTKLTNTFFEKRLGLIATTRNNKTVSRLLEMTAGLDGSSPGPN